MDECAYWDADGYDGGHTLERMSRALKAATDNSKVSYHADNAGGAHGKDTNEK